MIELVSKDIKTAIVTVFHRFKSQRKGCIGYVEIWKRKKRPKLNTRVENYDI